MLPHRSASAGNSQQSGTVTTVATMEPSPFGRGFLAGVITKLNRIDFLSQMQMATDQMMEVDTIEVIAANGPVVNHVVNDNSQAGTMAMEVKNEPGVEGEEFADQEKPRWIFTEMELEQSPSRKAGMPAHHEIFVRQQAAGYIQGMGIRLKKSQLAINNAIVFMHRFYMVHPMTIFDSFEVAQASLFLAGKNVEEVITMGQMVSSAHYVMCKETLSPGSEKFHEMTRTIIAIENVLIQTLGFDLRMEHPHLYVAQCFKDLRVPNEVAHHAYTIATKSLHFTTMCLEYSPKLVACACILAAARRQKWNIPNTVGGKGWYHTVDETLRLEEIEKGATEMMNAYEKASIDLKSKLNYTLGLAQQNKKLNKAYGHSISAATSPTQRFNITNGTNGTHASATATAAALASKPRPRGGSQSSTY